MNKTHLSRNVFNIPVNNLRRKRTCECTILSGFQKLCLGQAGYRTVRGGGLSHHVCRVSEEALLMAESLLRSKLCQNTLFNWSSRGHGHMFIKRRHTLLGKESIHCWWSMFLYCKYLATKFYDWLLCVWMREVGLTISANAAKQARCDSLICILEICDSGV